MSLDLFTSKPDKLLIVLFGAIGDVVRALPLAVRIKKNWPETDIHWAVEPRSKGVLDSFSAVDKIHLFDRPKGLSAYRDFIFSIKEENFPLVLDLQRHLKSGLTSWLTGAPHRLGYHRKGAREFNWIFNNHHIDAVDKFSVKTLHFQKFADLLGLPAEEQLDFGLEQNKVELNFSTEQSLDLPSKRSLVGILIGSTWPSRFWFPENYAEIIQYLESKHRIRSVLLGGPAEQEFAGSITSLLKPGSLIDLTGKTSLSELPAVFSKLKFALGSDSGPMHIAAGLGLPVISLWGSTSPLRSAPWGSKELLLKARLPCSPCYLKNCPGFERACMKQISPEMVKLKIDQVLLG